MARFDTVVKDGLVVIPYVGQLQMDIGIRGGRIAALEDQIPTSDAGELIDASGKVVLPGGVDTHFHLGIYRDMAQDTESETTSSVVGGVTSVVSYARTGRHYLNKSGPYKEIFPEILEACAGHARIDYGFHLAPMLSEHISEIPWLV
jgi:dihydroorotase-like cyclic amidohydrolase